MKRSFPSEGATVKRYRPTGWWMRVMLVAVIVAAVWRLATPRDDAPISRAEFAPPVRVEAGSGDGSELRNRFFRDRITVRDAVQEYANLTHCSTMSRGYLWFNELDVNLHGFLTRLKLRRGVERLSRLELPEGSMEFLKGESDGMSSIEAKPIVGGLSLAPPAAGMSVASLMSPQSTELYVPPAGYVSTTLSARILQLWTALRDRGVELKPMDGHRLNVVWHRQLKDGTPPAKP